MTEAAARGMLQAHILELPERSYPTSVKTQLLQAVDAIWIETYRLAYADGCADSKAGVPMSEEELEEEARCRK